jgi:hypothetical protein
MLQTNKDDDYNFKLHKILRKTAFFFGLLIFLLISLSLFIDRKSEYRKEYYKTILLSLVIIYIVARISRGYFDSKIRKISWSEKIKEDILDQIKINSIENKIRLSIYAILIILFFLIKTNIIRF